MAKAIMAIPEWALPDVIAVLEAGLYGNAVGLHWEIQHDNKEIIEQWIAEQKQYVDRDKLIDEALRG